MGVHFYSVSANYNGVPAGAPRQEKQAGKNIFVSMM